jgi:hypothetical protein
MGSYEGFMELITVLPLSHFMGWSWSAVGGPIYEVAVSSRIALQKTHDLTTVHFRDEIIVSILSDALFGSLAGRQRFHVFQKPIC